MKSLTEILHIAHIPYYHKLALDWN